MKSSIKLKAQAAPFLIVQNLDLIFCVSFVKNFVKTKKKKIEFVFANKFRKISKTRKSEC